MIRLLIGVLSVLLSTVVGVRVASAQLPACTHYAAPSPTGSAANNGTAIGTPFTVRKFWTVATPGSTLCLLDGEYVGADFMISPSTQGAPANLSGTSSARITVRALNDGQATLNGQFLRIPVYFNSNSWFRLEGFNAKNGNARVIFFENQSNNNEVRRVVAWDAIINANNRLIGTTTSAGPNLFEDVAGFGTARKIFSNSQGGNNVTCRRCWFRWEGNTYGGGGTATLFYDSFGARYENILVTYSGESMPQTYTEVSSGAAATNFGSPAIGRGALMSDRLDNAPFQANAQVNSALVYVKEDARRYIVNASGQPVAGGSVVGVHDGGGVTLRHVYSITAPGFTHRNSYRGIFLDNNGPSGGAVVTNVSASNITTVRGTTGNSIGAAWVVTGHSDHQSAGAAPSAWTATTTGANLCRRWVNGAVTNDPLWPWPMNQRIKDATTVAGAYPLAQCPGCTGTPPGTRTPTDVTEDVETLLGQIPSACRVESGPQPPQTTGLAERYEIDEAASGTAPSTVNDNSGVGTAFNLTANYGSGNVAYAEPAGNQRCLDFATAGGAGGPRAAIDGTKFKTSHHGKQSLSVNFVTNFTAVVAHSRVFTVNAPAGGTILLGIWLPDTSTLRFGWNSATEGTGFVGWTGLSLTGRDVGQIVFNSTEPVAANRVRFRLNGVDQGDNDEGTQPSQSLTLDLGSGNELVLGNASSNNRAPDGCLHYIDFWDQALSVADQNTIQTALASNDDADPLGGAPDPQPPVGIITDSVGTPVASPAVASLSAPLPQSNPVGNRMIAAQIAIRAGAPTFTMTTGGVSWTQVGATTTQGTTHIALWHKVAAAGEVSPVCGVSAIGSGHACIVMSYRNVDTTTPFDGVTPFLGGAVAAATWAPTGVTTLSANAVVVSVVGTPDDNAKILNTAQSFTERCSGAACDPGATPFIGFGVSDRTVVTAGAVIAPTWEQAVNGNDEWVGATFALRLAVDAPIPPPPQGGGIKLVTRPTLNTLPLPISRPLLQ